MTHQPISDIGNPVDAWWNTIRPQISSAINLLHQPPQMHHVSEAAIFYDELDQAQRMMKSAYYPDKARRVRTYMLQVIDLLLDSLYEMRAGDYSASLASFQMANNRYMLVCALLLQRGIYEPLPENVARNAG